MVRLIAVMKKIIFYTALLLLNTACNRLEIEEIINQSKSITQIRANIATNRTRVTLDVDPLSSDKTYWRAGDFLFVAELSEGSNLFTGHILKYSYVPSIPPNNESMGSFNGIGMVTGGKYLIVNTNIPYLFIGLPQIGDDFFECTFKSTFYYTASFGNNATEVQQIANELLFIGTATIGDSDAAINIPLISPMSMIEVRLTANTSSGKVERVTIESDDAVFSYKIYTDHSGKCQSESVSKNYKWEKLKSEVIFTAGHEQTLDNTTPLKIRILAFQKSGTQTSLKITAVMDDGSVLSYITPPQTQTLIPNAITVVFANF